MTSPSLILRDIAKVYPGTVALDRVSFDVLPGEVHGLIGKNGAGKSTLVGVLAGLIEPSGGSIVIGGRSFKSLSRGRARREGVAIVPQEPELIAGLTAAENLFLGGLPSRWGLLDRRGMRAAAGRVFAEYEAGIDPDQLAGDLPLSERQLLLVLRSCVVEDARIVVLDEASAPLACDDARNLRRIVRRLRSEGRSVIYISHQVDELLDVCDRVTVLRDGRVAAVRERSSLDRRRLSELIVGEGASLTPVRPGDVAPSGDEVLRLEGLSRPGAFSGISLSLMRGEILGLAGLRGSGRTELLKAIAGIDPAAGGAMFVKGWRVSPSPSSPSEAMAAGVAYLPEEREGEGLIRGFSVCDNLLLNRLGGGRGGLVNRRAARDRAARLFIDVMLKARSIHQDVDELSGGNRQKVVVGRVMAGAPDVCLLDEPTRGVDIGAKRAILSIVAGRFRVGAGVILTSPGLDDLVEVCDRIMVLSEGRIVGEYGRGSFSEKRLYLDMQGSEEKTEWEELENAG